MSAQEFRRRYGDGVCGPRNPGPVCSNNSKGKVRKSTVRSLSTVQVRYPELLFGGTFGIEVSIIDYKKGRRADGDNISKGILDALNGIAFRDDADCREWHGMFCDSKNLEDVK